MSANQAALTVIVFAWPVRIFQWRHKQLPCFLLELKSRQKDVNSAGCTPNLETSASLPNQVA